MMFSIHTFELSVSLCKEAFCELLSSAYERAKTNKHKLYEKNGVYRDEYLAKKSNKGIKIEYHNKTYEKKLKLIINPSRVLDGHDLDLWKPNEKNIDKLLHRLEKHIKDYFEAEYTLNDFRLTRMDFTANLNVGSKMRVSAYIKLLHRTGRVKGFSLKYQKSDKGIDKNLSFDLEGNSNGIEFSAYDKEAESKTKDAAGILRVEVRLTKQKALKRRTEAKTTAKQIRDLAGRSEAIFMDTFIHIVPPGDYYKKMEAVEIVEKSGYKPKQKDKMLALIELIAEKKSLLLAQKTAQYRNIDDVMGWFAKLDVSPVTIGKRLDMKFLDSLYSYL